MKKEILALYDSDEVYCSRLSEYLRSHLNLGFEIHSFTDISILNSFSLLQDISLLIISETGLVSLQNQSDEVRYKNIIVIDEMLSEPMVAEDMGDYGSCRIEHVSKFRSASVIADKVMSFVTDERNGFKSLFATGGAERLKVIGFYTPISRCGQTTLALRCGVELAKKGKAVFLSFESYSSLLMMLGQERSEDITDLLYRAECRSEDLCIFLEKIKINHQGLDIIAPAGTAAQIRELDADKIRNLIRLLNTQAGYEYVILDLSEFPEGFFDILQLCDRVFSIVKGSTADVYRFERFSRILAASDYEEVLAKLVRCDPPSLKNPEAYATYIDELTRGVSGDMLSA